MQMVRSLLALLGLTATLAVSNSTQPSANHVVARYVDVGDRGHSKILAADSTGNLFVVSTIIKPWGRPQIHVGKTDPAGNVLESFDFGGSGLYLADTVSGASADAQGNLVIVGTAYSADFPLVRPVLAVPQNQGAFVVKIDSQLQHILFSTVLGGGATGVLDSALSTGVGLAFDRSGNIYVSGTTNATDFPVTKDAFQTEPPQPDFSGTPTYAFVSEISADGTRLIFSTYFGASGTVCSAGPHGPICRAAYTGLSAMTLDPTGAVVIAGNTDANLPVTAGAFMPQCRMCAEGGTTGYLAKLTADGSKLAWATYVTPFTDSYLDSLTGVSISTMAVAGDGGVIVGGIAPNGLAVTPGALQPDIPGPGGGGFVAKLDSSGQRLVFATYLGYVTDGLVSAVKSITVDAQGTIWVTGGSDPTKLPLAAGTAALGPLYTVGLSSDGTSLISATTAPLGAAGMAIVATEQGAIVTLGEAGSLLIASPGQGPSIVGMANSGASQVSGVVAPLELISFYGVGVGPANPLGAHVITEGEISLVSTSLGGVQVFFDGIAAPLLYVGPTQINAIVPEGVYGRESTVVQIVTPGGNIAGLTFLVHLSQPQVFRYPGTKFAMAVNQDGTLNSESHPAAPDSIVSVWATGAGVSAPGAQPDGQIIPSSLGPLLTPQLPVSVLGAANVELGNQDSLEVLYAGDGNGMVQGVTQVNFRLPKRDGFQLQVGPALSEPFHIHMQ